jgi:hypothetical protein
MFYESQSTINVMFHLNHEPDPWLEQQNLKTRIHMIQKIDGDVVAQLAKATGDIRLLTRWSRVRIRHPSQPPERGQEI